MKITFTLEEMQKLLSSAATREGKEKLATAFHYLAEVEIKTKVETDTETAKATTQAKTTSTAKSNVIKSKQEEQEQTIAKEELMELAYQLLELDKEEELEKISTKYKVERISEINPKDFISAYKDLKKAFV
jgi:uncharacterized protein YacL (UPF0231 family)